MKQISIPANNNASFLRYGMLIPLALMITSIVSGCFSYQNAKQNLYDDLNRTMIALANENCKLWTRQDTIAALQQMHEATHKPLIYQASDLNFKNTLLKNEAFYSITLVDDKNTTPSVQGHKIASDSIIILPEQAPNGLAIKVQGFADCSIASVFAASDQTLPGFLLALSVLSMSCMFYYKRKQNSLMLTQAPVKFPTVHDLDKIKLTPMQRKLVQMFLDAPGNKVDKNTLCETLWGNKSNAEESLYTLIRRTKTALAEANLKIICNRGNSYELHITD